MPSVDEPEPIVVVLSGPIRLGTVDALARLQLAVGRLGGRVRLRAVPDELDELLDLVGMSDRFPRDGDLGDGLGETEEREKPLRIEEERDP